MDKMGNTTDFQEVDKAAYEVRSAMEEPIIIKKASAVGAVPASGLAPSWTYTSYASSAVVEDIGIEKANSNDNVYAVGDLQFMVRMKLQEPSASYPGDRIVYEAVEYRLVQKPMTEYLSGRLYWTCVGRRVTD